MAGVAFEDTAAPGYADFSSSLSGGIDFGYTPEMRLRYLRRFHRDPIDIDCGEDWITLGSALSVSGELTDLHVDSYEPWKQGGSTDSKDWYAFRDGVHAVLLGAVYRSARAAAPSLPLLMRGESGDAGFAPWTAADKPVRGIAAGPSTVYTLDYAMTEQPSHSLAADLAALKKSKLDASPLSPVLIDLVRIPTATGYRAAIEAFERVVTPPD
jgi:hypothetical protein